MANFFNFASPTMPRLQLLQLSIALTMIIQLGVCQNDDYMRLVKCRTTTDCTGNFTTMTKKRCCVDSVDGLAFTVDEDQTCHVCIVIGWFQESFTGIEQGPGHVIQAGYRKGRETAARNLIFNVTNIPGTAREGSNFDYTLGNSFVRALFDISSFDEVVVTFRVDSVALEVNETFMLELVPFSSTFTLPSGDGVFFINIINMTIIDHDTLNVFLTEDDYRALESSQSIPVRVAKDSRIATPVTVTVNPLTVMQAEELGDSILEQMPDDNPYSPNRAGLADFDNATVQVTFFPDEDAPINEHMLPITIVDDDINEASEQIFVVTLKHMESVREDSISFETRNSSLCRIIDNDNIVIGFEQLQYTFSEPQFSETFAEGPVFLVKENDRKSEQTFQIVYQISSSTPDSSIRSASLSERLPNGSSVVNDYVLSIAGRTTEVATFNPSQKRIPFIFTLFPDNLPESTEAFQTSIAAGENTPTFSISLAEAFIIIEDNDDIVIGFEETLYTVNEGTKDGRIEVCVKAFNPTDRQTLPATVSLTIQSKSNTATSDTDFTELSAEVLDVVLTFDDGQRRGCFEVQIVNDNVVENVEIFYVELKFIRQFNQSGVVLQPNMANITIIDDDAVIGFLNPPYTVSEGDGSAVLQVGVIEGSILGEVMIGLSTSDLTAVAGSDYQSRINHTLIFSSSITVINVPVTVNDDSITEPTETFTAQLSLHSELNNVTIQPETTKVTIFDDDTEMIQNVVIGFLGSPYSTNESAGILIVQVGIISGSLQTDIILNLSTTDATAIAGSDYESLVSVSVTFTPSTTIIKIPVKIIDDNVFESTEQFNLTLSHLLTVTGLTIDPATAEASIIDEDVVSPTGSSTTTVVVIVTVTVIVCIFVLICIVLIIVFIIVCLCCKRKRGFLAIKLQQIHDDDDEEAQQRQAPYSSLGEARQQVYNQTGLLSAGSIDNLSQDSL